MSVKDLISKAIDAAGGSQTSLGKKAGVSQNAIWQAMQRGRVSPELALGIHKATKGEVSASDLRPDLWPTRAHVPPHCEDVA